MSPTFNLQLSTFNFQPSTFNLLPALSALPGVQAIEPVSTRRLANDLTRATIGHQRKADFSDLVGRWTPDPAFDEILAAQRQIDWDKWK